MKRALLASSVVVVAGLLVWWPQNAPSTAPDAGKTSQDAGAEKQQDTNEAPRTAQEPPEDSAQAKKLALGLALKAAQAAKLAASGDTARLWEETPLTSLRELREQDPAFQETLLQQLTEATQDKTFHCAGELAELLPNAPEPQPFVYTTTLLVVSDGKTAEVKKAEAKHWDDAFSEDTQGCLLAALQGSTFPAETTYALKFDLPKRIHLQKK